MFSAISKTTSIAHTLDYGNSKKVGNILLSELFPYLYSSSNAMSNEEEEGGGDIAITGSVVIWIPP